MKTISLTTIASLLAFVSAAPVAQFGKRHQHHRRQDWGAIDWSTVKYDFSGVDWNTVNYDLSNVDWSTVFQEAATPAAAAVATASPVQTEAAVVQNNAVQAVAATPTTTVQAVVTAITQAGNVATTAVTTSSSGKRGLGWDPTSSSSAAAKLANGVSWYFNWSPTPSANMPSNWEFYANIWGSSGIADLANTLTGAPKLIGFNEPDSSTQSNIAVNEAISLYQQYLVPLKTSGKISELGTPAVTNSQNSGEGLDYLSNFVNGCAGNCNLDFAVVHWYAESLDDFKNHVTQAHTLTGLPVNVAEFAYTSWNAANEPTADEVMSFMTQAIAWLDEQSFVSAYAWFGSMYVSEAKYPSLGDANSLITESLDSLTSLGYAYCQ